MWHCCPFVELFQKLFRQDLLVASLFRNFLLAERVMRTYNCSPESHPSIPSTYNHPMWQAWDLALDHIVRQLPDLLESKATYEVPLFVLYAPYTSNLELSVTNWPLTLNCAVESVLCPTTSCISSVVDQLLTKQVPSSTVTHCTAGESHWSNILRMCYNIYILHSYSFYWARPIDCKHWSYWADF